MERQPKISFLLKGGETKNAVFGTRLPWSAFPVGLPFPPRHAHLREATRKDYVESR